MIELAYLEYQDGKQTKRFALEKSTVTLGRAPDCDLVLPFPQISRVHAQIVRQGEQYFVQDLKSANGTFVNDDPAENRIVKEGDVVRTGEFALRFHNPTARKILLTDDSVMDASMTISFPISQLSAAGLLGSGPKKRDPGQMIQLVFNVSKTLVGAKSLDDVLSNAMSLAFEYLKPDRGLLMLFDEAGQQLVPYVVKQGKKQPGAGSLSFSRTIVNKVFQEGVSILTANAMGDKRFSNQESIVMQQIRSCMCVPLWDERKTIGILYIDSLFFENYFQEWDLDLLSTIAIISAIAIEQSRLNDVLVREKAIREKLQRYHSPSVVNRIIAGGGDVLRTEEREISVLFADLVGFTTFSEELEPAEVARVLNTFFSVVTDIIFKNEGTLDKYIGDAVMAVFGAPLPQQDHARRAVDAAVEMFHAVGALNRSGSLPRPLHMRIGVNSGRVVAGDIGSEKRLDYTVLGSTVNIASRIESSVAKSGEIVIGASTRDLLGDSVSLTDLGLMKLRGLSSPMGVFRVNLKPDADSYNTMS